MWRRPTFLVSACLLSSACAAQAEPPGAEVSVCGRFREPLTFALWSHIAGRPDPARAQAISNAEAITYRTRDGRTLHGYKLRSTAAGGAVTGSLLVAQGNAMLADQLLSDLTGFGAAGIEVYLFDYRGYGHSEGRRRLTAILGDYLEIAQHLAASVPGRHLLHGISFGGIVLLNAIGAGVGFDRAVIDSTPSRISDFGCPARYDPVAHVPADASGMLFIAGGQDTVVPVADSAELVSRAGAQGARAEVRAAWAHPFMDSDEEIRRARLDLVRSFLLQ